MRGERRWPSPPADAAFFWPLFLLMPPATLNPLPDMLPSSQVPLVVCIELGKLSGSHKSLFGEQQPKCKEMGLQVLKNGAERARKPIISY
jgi:hypothetical protein